MGVIRVGIVGLGANTKLRHLPGLRACREVEITGVCNRTPESTAAAAREHAIPRTYGTWQELVGDPGLDAVVIGTWPYLHGPITVAALAAGKHVLTEARMALNLAEARQMYAASRSAPHLVAQIVPSPMGLRADRTVRRLVREGFLGELREVVVLGTSDAYADPAAPLHWRQVARYSGVNALVLGILQETLLRWVPPPVRVVAQAQVFTTERLVPDSGKGAPVETPDSVQVMTQLPGGARGVYHVSGVAWHGPGPQIHLYGSQGTLQYLLGPEDRLMGGRCGEAGLREIVVPESEVGGWRVEAEFIAAIRGEGAVERTDFAAGLQYMEFSEAVVRSAASGSAVSLPLAE